MIINARGTGGSGKSTVARRTMERYLSKTPVRIDGRKQPIGYVLQPYPPKSTPLYVVGHYETPCGGGDTITNVADVFSTVRERALAGFDVFFEGIISQDDTRRTIDLHLDKVAPLLVLFLTTPLADCLKGIQERRNERGDERPLNSKNTESRMKRCASHYSKLRDSGVECLKVTRDEALEITIRRLGLAVVNV